jgi:hypothetical protein
MADQPREHRIRPARKSRHKSPAPPLGRITEMVNRSYGERTGQADEKVQKKLC